MFHQCVICFFSNNDKSKSKQIISGIEAIKIHLSFALNPEFTLSFESPVHLGLDQLSKLFLVEIGLAGRKIFSFRNKEYLNMHL